MDATIVIPTHNRRATVLRTLDALLGGVAGVPTWEAVVVDDGSTDGTAGAVADWARTREAPVRCLTQPNAGPATARNRGAFAGEGRVLVLIDDDIHVRPGFLARHLGVLRDHPDAWVIGRVVHPEGLRSTPFGRWRDDQWERFHREHPAGLGETVGITAANLALPRRDFLRLGGFDERFPLAGCEDAELGLRARAAGVRVLYDSENLVVHDDWATSLPRYCERQRLYAVTDALLYRTYGARSPRAALVRANAPGSREDSAAQRARKAAKAVLATRPGRAAVAACCALAERIWPDRAPSHRCYRLAVGVAIFRGVREGLRRFPAEPA